MIKAMFKSFKSFQAGRAGEQSGFTLLELLVVISIIGILMAMIAVAFGTAQIRGRDAKRRGDIKGMQNAFEQYFAVNSTYASCNTMRSDTDTLPGGAPTDPKDGSSYACSVSGAASYCICALLESDGQGNATAAPNAGACSFGSGSNANYFCAANLQ